jgi:uncharacterized membrane protein
MRWLTWHWVGAYLRGSAWPVPTAAIPAALLLAPLVRTLDARTGWVLLGYGHAEAIALLGAIIPAALTMVVLILSMLLLAVQLAASQFSPRLIGGQLARAPIKACMFVMVFTYVYSAGVLGRIGERVPQLPVVVAIVLTMISVGAGLFLIDYLAKELRPVRMLARTADVGRAVIESVYPTFVTGTGAETSAGRRLRLPGPGETVPRVGRSGVLLAIDIKGLVAVATRTGCVIEVVPQVGDFVARGEPTFRIYPRGGAIPAARLAALVIIGNERTFEQDPAFAFRILVDVAAKALSPAINDPTTAVLAIDQIHHLLRQVGRRRLDTGEVRDADGTLRVVYRTPDWDDFVLLATTEVRQYGSGSIQVARRLRAMLENLIDSVPPARTAVLRKELRLLQTGVERSFSEPEDRTSAERGDNQGMGGSREGMPEHAGVDTTPAVAAG